MDDPRGTAFAPDGHLWVASDDDDSGGVLENQTDGSARPETLEAWASFHEAVDTIPDDEREVFQLVWYGGMQQQDVASLLEVSVPTVKRRMHRARKRLSVLVAGEFPAAKE